MDKVFEIFGSNVFNDAVGTFGGYKITHNKSKLTIPIGETVILDKGKVLFY